MLDYNRSAYFRAPSCHASHFGVHFSRETIDIPLQQWISRYNAVPNLRWCPLPPNTMKAAAILCASRGVRDFHPCTGMRQMTPTFITSTYTEFHPPRSSMPLYCKELANNKLHTVPCSTLHLATFTRGCPVFERRSSPLYYGKPP